MKSIFFKKKLFLLFFLTSLFLKAQSSGIFFGKIDLGLSIPFILSSTKEVSQGESELFYGDKFFSQITFPFDLQFALGYNYPITKANTILIYWNFKYSDDPLNSLVSANIDNKDFIPSFTSQSINNLVVLSSKNYFSFFNWTISTFGFFDLNREEKTTSFYQGLKNKYVYNFNTGLDFFLKSVPIKITPNFSYTFNHFPNDRISLAHVSSSTNISVIPTILQDFHTISPSLKFSYRPINNLILDLKYTFGYDLYTQNPIVDGDLRSNSYTSENKQNFRNKINFDITSFFLPRRSYYLLSIKLAYLFRSNLSNYIEVLNIQDSQIGDLFNKAVDPNFSQFIPVNNTFIILVKDYENFIYNSIGLYPNFTFHPLYSLTLGYSFSIKHFLNHYARYGINEKSNRTFGSYKDKNRVDINHNLFISFLLQNKSKNLKFKPYLGMQFSSSNDYLRGNNKDLYFLGLIISYEF